MRAYRRCTICRPCDWSARVSRSNMARVSRVLLRLRASARTCSSAAPGASSGAARREMSQSRDPSASPTRNTRASPASRRLKFPSSTRGAKELAVELYVMATSYDSRGSHLPLSRMCDFLLRDAPHFGDAIKEIGLTFYFPSSDPPRESLERSYEEHERYRATLPKVVYRRT